MVSGERNPEDMYTTRAMPPPPPHHLHHHHHNRQFSDSNRRIIPDKTTSQVRLYQAWKGSNVFCFGGRLVFGPDVRSLFLTISLVVAPVVFFCAFVTPNLGSELRHHIGNAVAFISVIFTACVIFLLFLTSGRDPGIIPRNPHPPEDEGSAISADWVGIHGAVPSLPPTKDVVVNGMTVRVKYCQTCMLYRPPRCSHCSICNNCVERFDHHCPWVGQCIGKRNYRFFFMFVSSTTMLCLYVFAFCWVNVNKIMKQHHCNLWTSFMKSPASGILILYTFICAWFVGGLTAFHLYLIFTNQTTYENFRYRYDGKTNPYNLGCVGNTREVFFSKIPRSKNSFRAKVDVESPFYTALMPLGPALSPAMPKRSFDVEVEKRQAVADEDLEDIQSQIDSVGGLERCSTMPGHRDWDHNKSNWEMSPDICVMAAEFDMERRSTDRQFPETIEAGLRKKKEERKSLVIRPTL